MSDYRLRSETFRRSTAPGGWTEEADAGTMHGALSQGRL
jgi:hypothetical protein